MRNFIVCFLGVLSFGHFCRADDAGPTALSEVRDQQHFSISGGELVSYFYEEPGIMHIWGQMTRAEIGYHRALHLRRHDFWWAADISYAYGNLTYSGGLQSGSGNVTPVQYRDKDSITIMRGRFGMPLFDTGGRVLNVYAGLAIWDLKDKASGLGSYDREITYFYVPVGAEYVMKMGAFTWASSLEYNPQLFGIVQSKLSEAGFNSDLTNTQVLGFGFKVATSAEIDTGPLSITAEAFFQFWSIPASSQETDTQTSTGTVVNLEEPKNDTEMVGVNLGVRF